MSEPSKGETGKAREIGVGSQGIEYVRREIEAGRLGPGDRLPPERDLARQMGVSVSAPGGSLDFLWMMAANREGADRQFGVVNVQPEYASGGSGLERGRVQ